MIVDTLNKPNIAEIYPKPFVPGSSINESPVSVADLNGSRIIYQAKLTPIAEQLPIVQVDKRSEQNKEKTPFTFDLSRERELALRFGGAYWHFFKEQTTYYLQEVYGKVPLSDHYHDIEINEQGRAELWYGTGEMRRKAKESYITPANDPALPDWLRARYRRDVVWAEAMEEYINQGYTGTLFDVSPTAEVAREQKIPWGLKAHSFSRLSQVETIVDEQGQEKRVLRTHNIRNYLDDVALEDLFENITGERVASRDLLGTVRRARPGHNPKNIGQMGYVLYENTPDDRRIEIPEEDKVVRTAQEIVHFTNELDNLLEGVFLMLQDPKISNSEIEKLFHGFEMEIRDRVEGKTVNPTTYKHMSSRSFLDSSFRNSDLIIALAQRQYIPSASDCPGAGSGFGNSINIISSGAGSYSVRSSASGVSLAGVGARSSGISLGKEADCPAIKCPKCGWTPTSSQLKDLEAGSLKACPGKEGQECGHVPR